MIPEPTASISKSPGFGSGRIVFHLAPLPEVLQEKAWFAAAVSQSCSVCNTVPERPALCLLCGLQVCKNATCCRNNLGDGECTRHFQQCHGGGATGLYLDIKESTTLILRNAGGGEIAGAIWKSPYLDPYGESDEGLRRGRLVTLHPPMIEELRRRVICCTLIDLTVNTGRRLLLAGWNVF